ncbi:unnamed protein product [Rangifer tarandus platyrhynchus]|uniref:Uncharacterized protein n=2 Tax=Rangifer tarandus platyrhynchus TaxID=3082113 RepID=A0ACB0EQ30_RANTA|nr:unnamed protein product [Rangifer tarandus platyrhynchus]CAI9702299.1 unnamed protein product [Rangifer tarandus platyrhynchus]
MHARALVCVRAFLSACVRTVCMLVCTSQKLSPAATLAVEPPRSTAVPRQLFGLVPPQGVLACVKLNDGASECCGPRQSGQSRAENRPVSCQAIGRSLGEARPSSGVGVGRGPGLCRGHLGWTCRWWQWAVSGTTPGRLRWNSSAPGRRRPSLGPGTLNLVLCQFVQLPVGSSAARAVGIGVVFCFPSPSVMSPQLLLMAETLPTHGGRPVLRGPCSRGPAARPHTSLSLPLR